MGIGGNQGPRGPLPIPGGNQELSNNSSSTDDGEFPPPPPIRGNGAMSADNSLDDSASTTQSNVTSECSEAECDREPLVKPGDNVGGNRASVGSPKDLTT